MLAKSTYRPALPHASPPPLHRCPACGHRGLWATCTRALEQFVCPGCGGCWHFDRGLVQRTDPAECPGFPSRAICTRPDWDLIR